jgi:hypothetical protein
MYNNKKKAKVDGALKDKKPERVGDELIRVT